MELSTEVRAVLALIAGLILGGFIGAMIRSVWVWDDLLELRQIRAKRREKRKRRKERRRAERAADPRLRDGLCRRNH